MQGLSLKYQVVQMLLRDSSIMLTARPLMVWRTTSFPMRRTYLLAKVAHPTTILELTDKNLRSKSVCQKWPQAPLKMKKHRKRKRKAKNLRRYHATTVIDCRLRIKRSILSRSRQRRILSFLKSQGLNKQYIGSLMYYHQRKKSPDGSASNRESAKKRRGPL